MQKVKCRLHDLELKLPTTEDEFTSGHLHGEIERLQDHHEKNPNCKFMGDFDEQ